MTRIKLLLLAVVAAVLISGCTVHGVHEYQRALHMGCTTTSGGGLICPGG